ncbi:hypothetical protein [Flavobacterium sp. S87F.05.LMB.W.Kidney.N]|uniref:hypothetical protein n=1 Tax=Flavobacterium sp. S87F.05.LMB.W.Kidney.N TaxID=1278758 RepID=UPI001066C6CD|nr:hypothetical protein [Flavobacterium sp. S87F.05.LMB.W.Kidney.N]TDX13388.1 hypothetical protein EDB96_0082 [Flavobacterium sp. S87F.05.LMB.W.Kidney.N]
MDSKQLFRLYNSKFFKANWLNENGELAQNDGEVKWLYCGINQDFDSEIVNEAINTTFEEDEVYLFISSNKSSLVSKSIVAEEIGKMLHKKEIGVMNISCTKIIHFTTYGVFESGIIRELPKSRLRTIGTPLKIAFHANILDSSTEKVADAIEDYFPNLEKELYKDYGGVMEHLWIDLELVERYSKDRDSWSFRFQKRVDIRASHTELYTYNVGHYSVKPDFEKLRSLSSKESICSYVFELLYESTQILVDKEKKLNGFNAKAFREDFLSACVKLGYIDC